MAQGGGHSKGKSVKRRSSASLKRVTAQKAKKKAQHGSKRLTGKRSGDLTAKFRREETARIDRKIEDKFVERVLVERGHLSVVKPSERVKHAVQKRLGEKKAKKK